MWTAQHFYAQWLDELQRGHYWWFCKAEDVIFSLGDGNRGNGRLEKMGYSLYVGFK